jgi:carboxyl-terminal processing protease
MKKRYLIILVFISIIAGFIYGSKSVETAQAKDKKPNTYESLSMFAKVMHILESTYVEKVKVKDLIYGGIQGMLEALDPHSVFLKPENYKEMKESTMGKFGGLGIEITKKDKILTIITPIEDTPAWKAGLKSMDKIIEIDGKSTLDMDLQAAVNKMRGKPGTSVTLTIAREGKKNTLKFKITRKIIKIKSVKFDMLPEDYAYIRISTFNENTTKNFQSAYKNLKRKAGGKLKGLLLDLRNNPGGLLDQAVSISDAFLNKGAIVSVMGRDKNKKAVEYASSDTTICNIPVVVLINQSSASASEIVAGALQDQDRAVVIGQKTFGKGSVQTLVELDDDSAIKYTIARYYTPNGTSIQAKGIEPDIEVMPLDPRVLEAEKLILKETKENYGEAKLKGHFENEEKINKIYEIAKQGLDKKIEKRDLTKVIDLDYDYQAKLAYNYLKIYALGKRQDIKNKGGQKK